MPSKIPFTGVPRESMDVILAGRSLRLRSRYANLVGTWRLDIEDLDGDDPTPILTGIPIVVGVDLLAPYGLGLGSLFAEATERSGDDPKRGELGGRVSLIHYAPSELEAT